MNLLICAKILGLMKRVSAALLFATVGLWCLSGCQAETKNAEPQFMTLEEQIDKIESDPNLDRDAKDAAIHALKGTD